MEWRYLHEKAKVKHALQRSTDSLSICGVSHQWFANSSDWLGTGNQHEYEKIKQLPECGRCKRILGIEEL